MIEVNMRQPGFLGEPRNPITDGYLFKRKGPRDWEMFNHKVGTGQWQKIIDGNILDALEAGYVYGREYLRWQINQCRVGFLLNRNALGSQGCRSSSSALLTGTSHENGCQKRRMKMFARFAQEYGGQKLQWKRRNRMITNEEQGKLLLPEGGFSLGVVRDIQEEHIYASKKFPPFQSAHEGLSIIEEEFEELKREVFAKKRTYPHMRKEAIQLATMALRFVKDICDDRAE